MIALSWRWIFSSEIGITNHPLLQPSDAVATGGIMIMLLAATIVWARVSGFSTEISRPDD
jgi:ABC-type sugar transport system permease subunit